MSLNMSSLPPYIFIDQFIVVITPHAIFKVDTIRRTVSVRRLVGSLTPEVRVQGWVLAQLILRRRVRDETMTVEGMFPGSG